MNLVGADEPTSRIVGRPYRHSDRRVVDERESAGGSAPNRLAVLPAPGGKGQVGEIVNGDRVAHELADRRQPFKLCHAPGTLFGREHKIRQGAGTSVLDRAANGGDSKVDRRPEGFADGSGAGQDRRRRGECDPRMTASHMFGKDDVATALVPEHPAKALAVLAILDRHRLADRDIGKQQQEC